MKKTLRRLRIIKRIVTGYSEQSKDVKNSKENNETDPLKFTGHRLVRLRKRTN